MQLRQCFARAKPTTENRPEKARFFWLFFPKKPKVLKKNRISKSGFKTGKLATVLNKN